ncbi:conjugal transfer protein TraB [Chryseobacterium sp. IHB B 17019]|uniref:DUF3408 domain-containing protein n=1 Tax=Chryseobacterium sp. IHB B 17019 TaxID=1721091 RepID=UPI000722409A|nr:DUF3408 domain-containing protein [Chryseobacterium sp. IHB B 17019]ALR29229.1 conjugal transfer protein TraB [Chryseobacterium sp. IHB B 17019]
MEKGSKKSSALEINEKEMMHLMVDGVRMEGLKNNAEPIDNGVERAVERTVQKDKSRLKRTNEANYEHIFLNKVESNARDGKTVYIRKDFHEKLSRIVQVIGEDKLTIYAYLDNLLAYHFEEFGEQITKSFNDKYKPIL